MTHIVNELIDITKSAPGLTQQFTKDDAQKHLYKLQKFAEAIQTHLSFLEKNYQTKMSMEMKSHDLRDIRMNGIFWSAPVLSIGSTKVAEYNFIAQPQYHHLMQDGASIKVKQTWKLLSDFISAFHQHQIPSAAPCTINITSSNVSIELQAILRETQSLKLDTKNETLEIS